jgi:protein-S-isoprenylcysteine O-methyltransferase Ste14
MMVALSADGFADADSRLFVVGFVAVEGLVVVFVLIRRGTQEVSLRPFDWVIAFGGSALPFFVQPGGSALVAPLVAGPLVLVGMGVQVWAKLILRRSFGVVPANRGVKVRGPYRLVRHPMYFGYMISHVGLFLLSPLPLNAVIYLTAAAFQIVRILAEERVLSRAVDYREYQDSVGWRLMPGIF